MDSNHIKRVFLDFFAERDHAIVPSASLIPVDPTLLLTGAGMVPFKPYMLGEEEPPYRRAATVQKCARTTDIEVVGTTARHLTFFEMLGNFSFGDYFKEKAIPWAFQLATEQFGLDADRLWYTVHETDDEAEEIWVESVGVPSERVQRRGRDNFWQMGVPGPAGPASEIFYDKGPEYGPDGGPVVDEERFVEFWNLVFMQNIQDEPYNVIGDLPAKNIDTGAGLERVAVVLQRVDSVFETDVMRPILGAGEKATKVQYGSQERSDVSLRILADHGRAVTFLIADGVVPSNEGRGHILRRLIRRAVRHAFLLGNEALIMPSLVEATAETMGAAYPDLLSRQDFIVEMVTREEERFRRTLESGHQLLDQALQGVDDGGVLSGATAFKLHDTYGFPVELTEEILAERGRSLDRVEFETMMDEQRTRARAALKSAEEVEAAEAYRSLLGDVGATEFLGYEDERGHGRILSILRQGESVERAEEGEAIEVYADRTPFYAESGGQVGDSGLIDTETGVVRVEDTQFGMPGLHGHRGRVLSGAIWVGQEASMVIDADRRERIRKNHTGTHLLHWGLREVLGDHVQQAGSLVAPDRLRFDFSHYSAVDPESVREIESAVNDRVVDNSTVRSEMTSLEEAEQRGALAFFGDKYGDNVRVVSAGDYSVELCGGTHVPSTGQVGPLVLTSEGSIGSNLRRVEALTGSRAFAYLSDVRLRMEETAALLRTQPGKLVETAASVSRRLQEQEERLAAFADRERAQLATTIIDQAEQHGERTLLVAQQDGLSGDELRSLAFQVRARLGSGVGVLGTEKDGKGAVVAFVSADLVAEGVSAGELITPAATILGGGAGPDADLAQAGGPRGAEMPAALESARDAARVALSER